MTCIVGLVDNGKVWIGGDAAGSDGYSMDIRADGKVWAKDGMAFGFTTSFRMGQLLRYDLTIPKRFPDTDLMAFLVRDFINAVRGCLKGGGFATTKDGAEVGGNFLVGVGGRLFCIESDYQVAESQSGYYAVGSGAKIALGSLFSTKKLPAKHRVMMALEAAAHHSCHVAPPFHVESV